MNIIKILIFSSILLFFVVPNVACIHLSEKLYEQFPELLSMRNAFVEYIQGLIPRFDNPFAQLK